jgi:hypothetical protein
MNTTQARFVVADNPSVDNIPAALQPLLDEIIALYQQVFGQRLLSVYVHGSASRGDWKPGKSDLDTFAVVAEPATPAEEALLLAYSERFSREQAIVSTVELTVIDKATLISQSYRSNILNLKLVLTGVCVWGEAIDFMQHLPSNEVSFGQYTHQGQQYIEDYRQHPPSVPTEQEGLRLTRRYAKRAVRIINLMAVLRGAALRTAIPLQYLDIKQYVPEAAELMPVIKQMCAGEINDPARAVGALQASIDLYASCYPVYGE